MTSKRESARIAEAEGLLHEARNAIDAREFATTERLAKQALRLLGRSLESTQARTAYVTAHLQLACVCAETGRPEEGLDKIAVARGIEPEERECDYLEGRIRLSDWDLDRAEECFRRSVDHDFFAASAMYHLAIAADARHDFARADQLYAAAHEREPARYSLPVRIPDDEAEALLRDVVETLPSEIRELLNDPLIEMRSVPDPKLDRVPPETLGVYNGVTLAEQSSRFHPEYIRVFQRSVERVSLDEEDLRDQLRVTLLHEIGHHFGYDEGGLDELGLA